MFKYTEDVPDCTYRTKKSGFVPIDYLPELQSNIWILAQQ
jgi:hypothetical protein